MSDHLTIDEIESKLSIIVRKPQEGKTSICIDSILKDPSETIHLVLTMNTLSAGMQFFGRMERNIQPKRIVVFNSDKSSAGDCHHAKSVINILKLIKQKSNNIKVIVCCAHTKRFKESIHDLLDMLTDSKNNYKCSIHIDEAHKYIVENIQDVREFNNSAIITAITGYTATPDNIWKDKPDDPLFYRILIRDPEKELSIIKSPNYFGVKSCDLIDYNHIEHNTLIKNMAINSIIPESTLENSSKPFTSKHNWYEAGAPFSLGNEILLLSFIKYILPVLMLPSDVFSYNFIPGYCRKVTHYEIMELIHNVYPTANVIIYNGNGIQLFRRSEVNGKSSMISNDEKMKSYAEQISCPIKKKKEKDALNEPAYMNQQLIKDTSNYPTFITGFHCIGMSVTLINEIIGNFDHVICDHQHFKKDILYQLCRFMFKFEYWTPENRLKIKKTKFHSLTKEVIDICSNYESHVEKICAEYQGEKCTLREINGEEPSQHTERELKMIAIQSTQLVNTKQWKKFKVYDGNDDIIWSEAENFYKQYHHKGKGFTKKTKPTINASGFYEYSTDKGPVITRVATFDSIENEKWTNRFALNKHKYSYVRAFVGYERLDDPSEYTIFIKYVRLSDTDHNKVFLNTYGIEKKKKI